MKRDLVTDLLDSVDRGNEEIEGLLKEPTFIEDTKEPCPVLSRSHKAHDDKINELEEAMARMDRTPRVLSAYILQLENRVRTLEKQAAQKEWEL